MSYIPKFNDAVRQVKGMKYQIDREGVCRSFEPNPYTKKVRILWPSGYSTEVYPWNLEPVLNAPDDTETKTTEPSTGGSVAGTEV